MSNKYVICLGYFDCVHKGHRAVIESAMKRAKEKDEKTVVFTFSENLKGAFLEKSKSIYTFNERINLFNDLGIEEVVSLPVNSQTLSISGREFLDLLNEKYQISEYFCGEDYKFGFHALSDVRFLKEYANSHKQTVNIVPTEKYFGGKVSSTLIKMFLGLGEIHMVNDCLVTPYFVSGTVIEGKQLGRSLGYKTANIEIDKDKFVIRRGVYAGYTYIDGVKYRTIINYGSSLTLDEVGTKVEAHLLDFDGDLYGKELIIYFTDFIRDIIKFNSLDELKEQIAKDECFARGGL